MKEPDFEDPVTDHHSYAASVAGYRRRLSGPGAFDAGTISGFIDTMGIAGLSPGRQVFYVTRLPRILSAVRATGARSVAALDADGCKAVLARLVSEKYSGETKLAYALCLKKLVHYAKTGNLGGRGAAGGYVPEVSWITPSQYRSKSGGRGGTENPIPIRVEVSPQAGGQARDMHGYLYDKAYHDTGDAGFGRIVSGDAYPVHSRESGTGKVDLKLRRVSSQFDTYRIQGGMSLDGLHITELAPAYFENSHNASLAVPLNVGLGSPSPLSVTIHANNVSRQYDYRHTDFGVPHRITVNAAQDNGLEAARQDGTVSIAPQPGFGRITSLYVDGIRAEVPCDTGCVINTPSNRPVDIAAENAWGGRARMSVPELAVPEDPPAQSAAPGNLAVIVPFLVLLPVLYWMYRRIRRDGRP